MTAWNSLGESIFQEYNDLQIIFFERRQKAFAGFLLDDRKEKKNGCYNVFTTSTTDSTLLKWPTNYQEMFATECRMERVIFRHWPCI